MIEPSFTLDSPYLADYFGAWAVHGPTFAAMVERVNGTNLHEHLQSSARAAARERASEGYETTEDGVAVIRIVGATMKAVPSLASGTSTVVVRQQLRAARKDPAVRAAMLAMDTPGGTVKGNQDLADEVTAFASTKPIYAFVEDMTASAGVAIASQAHKRYANQPTALYGAMGTYSVLVDYSGMAENLGVRVHVIKAGDFKGMGEPGTKVTPEQLAEVQRLINAMNDAYLATIAKGLRKSLSEVRTLADGRIHTATDAVRFGLLDGIQSFDETYRQLVQATSPTRSTEKATAMATKNTAVNAESIIEQFDAAVSALTHTGMERSKAVATVARRNPGLHAQYLEAINSQPHLMAGTTAQQREQVIAGWNAAVDREMLATGGDKLRAVAQARRKHPTLHQAFIEATGRVPSRRG